MAAYCLPERVRFAESASKSYRLVRKGYGVFAVPKLNDDAVYINGAENALPELYIEPVLYL